MVFSVSFAAAAAKSLQSCLTLCDPIEGSPPGSPIPEILQARTLEWVAISFSNAWKWKVKVKLLSRVWLLATPWTAAHQAPLSMEFSRQEYWSGVSCFPKGSRELFKLKKNWVFNFHSDKAEYSNSMVFVKSLYSHIFSKGFLSFFLLILLLLFPLSLSSPLSSLSLFL